MTETTTQLDVNIIDSKDMEENLQASLDSSLELFQRNFWTVILHRSQTITLFNSAENIPNDGSKHNYIINLCPEIFLLATITNTRMSAVVEDLEMFDFNNLLVGDDESIDIKVLASVNNISVRGTTEQWSYLENRIFNLERDNEFDKQYTNNLYNLILYCKNVVQNRVIDISISKYMLDTFTTGEKGNTIISGYIVLLKPKLREIIDKRSLENIIVSGMSFKEFMQ